MNKKELVTAIAGKTGLTVKDSEKAVMAFTEAVKEALLADEKVTLVGFGTFEARYRAEREGHNPQTGEKLRIAACRLPAFKAGKAFKEDLN